MPHDAPPHEILGVGPDATGPELTEAFRRFALRHHPDRGGDADRFQAGLDAYHRMTGSKRPTRTGAADVVFHRRTRLGVASILRSAGRRLAATRSRS